MAMAKTKKWLVRNVGKEIRPQRLIYFTVYVGRRPYLSKNGHWVGKREYRVGPRAVEALLPKEYQLKAGDGPVELKT